MRAGSALIPTVKPAQKSKASYVIETNAKSPFAAVTYGNVVDALAEDRRLSLIGAVQQMLAVAAMRPSATRG